MEGGGDNEGEGDDEGDGDGEGEGEGEGQGDGHVERPVYFFCNLARRCGDPSRCIHNPNRTLELLHLKERLRIRPLEPNQPSIRGRGIVNTRGRTVVPLLTLLVKMRTKTQLINWAGRGRGGGRGGRGYAR